MKIKIECETQTMEEAKAAAKKAAGRAVNFTVDGLKLLTTVAVIPVLIAFFAAVVQSHGHPFDPVSEHKTPNVAGQ